MKTYERFSAALDELFLRLKTQRLWYKLEFERSEEEMRNPETGIKTPLGSLISCTWVVVSITARPFVETRGRSELIHF